MAAKSRIHLIATGGTIAGTAPDPADTRNYTAGVLTAEQLIASVPPLTDLAEISVEQLYNLDSKDMTPDHWLGLARATQAALARDDVDGVVITHGTDTMEESAFFLDLVLPPGKPVVFTGAMRPATALSADGPMNLYGAVLLAASSEAHGLGVVAVLHNCIHAARDLRKAHSHALEAFSSGEAGILGRLPPLRLIRRLEPHPPFDLGTCAVLPRVDMLLVGAGSSPDLATAAVAAGAQGLVLALPGNGSLPAAWGDPVETIRNSGVPVIRASHADGGVASDPNPHILPCSPHPPAKARIALMLALAVPGAVA